MESQLINFEEMSGMNMNMGMGMGGVGGVGGALALPTNFLGSPPSSPSIPSSPSPPVVEKVKQPRKRPRRLTKKKEEQRNKRVQEATYSLNALIKFCLLKVSHTPDLALVDTELPIEEANHPEDLEGKKYFKKNKVEGYLYSGHQFTEGLREWALRVDTGNFPFTLSLVREVRSCWKTPTSSPKRTCNCTREVAMTRTTWSLRVNSQEGTFFWAALTDFTLYQYAVLKDTERKELTTFKGTDILQQFVRLHPTLYSHLYAFFAMKQQANWPQESVPQLTGPQMPTAPPHPHAQVGGPPFTQPPLPYANRSPMLHPPMAGMHPPHPHHPNHPMMGHPVHIPPQPQRAPPPMNPRAEGQSDVLNKILSPLQPTPQSNNDQILEDQKFTLMLVYKYYLKLAETDALQAIEGLMEKISYPAFVKCHLDSLQCTETARGNANINFDTYFWVAANEKFIDWVREFSNKKLPRSSIIGKRAHSPELAIEKKMAYQYALTDIECCKGPGYIHTTPLQKEGLLLHKIATHDKKYIFGLCAPNPQNTPSMTIYTLHSPSPSPSPMVTDEIPSGMPVHPHVQQQQQQQQNNAGQQQQQQQQPAMNYEAPMKYVSELDFPNFSFFDGFQS